MEEDGNRPSARVGRIGLAPSARRQHARSCTHSRCASSPRGVAIEKHAARQRWRLGEENQRLGYIP